MKIEKDHPNVIAPPPLIFFSGLLAGGIVDWFSPLAVLPSILSSLVGSLLVFSGLSVIAIAFLQMRSARTNIEPWKPTTRILDKGVFGVSRNPVYLAMIAVYCGVAFLYNSAWFLPFLPFCVLAIHYGVILREETYLERKFGDEYVSYKGRVKRWI
jgi:protein-S-isoprenylcysteine O-methyltransferase Ste14